MTRTRAINPAVMHARVFGPASLTHETVTSKSVFELIKHIKHWH